MCLNSRPLSSTLVLVWIPGYILFDSLTQRLFVANLAACKAKTRSGQLCIGVRQISIQETSKLLYTEHILLILQIKEKSNCCRDFSVSGNGLSHLALVQVANRKPTPVTVVKRNFKVHFPATALQLNNSSKLRYILETYTLSFSHIKFLSCKTG